MLSELIPFALNVYSFIYNATFIVLEQGKKSTNALVDSFDKPVLYFFAGSPSPQVSNRIFLESGASWYYDSLEKKFVNPMSSGAVTHLPFISAILMDAGQEVGNLSEWMESVKANGDVPLSCIVVAWAYCSSVKLRYPLEYTLSVFTADGEEKELDVLKGQVLSGQNA